MSAQSQPPNCLAVGPYLPIGRTDWECKTHNVELERDRAFHGLPAAEGGWYCPVGIALVEVPSAFAKRRKAHAKRRHANSRQRKRLGVALDPGEQLAQRAQ